MPSSRCTGIGCRSPPSGQMSSDERDNNKRTAIRTRTLRSQYHKKTGKTRHVPRQLSSCTNYAAT